MWVGRVRIGDKVLSDDDGMGLDSILQKEYHFALAAKCLGEEEVRKIQKVFFLLDRVVYDESFHGHVDRGAVAQDCFQKGAKSLGLNHCKFSF